MVSEFTQRFELFAFAIASKYNFYKVTDDWQA